MILRLLAGVTVQIAGVIEVNVTARPELAVAPEGIVAALKFVAPGLANVIVCVVGAMTKATFCVAAGFTPFVAVTTILNVPPAVGVPDRAPPAASDIPAGSAPVVTLNVGAGFPEAVKVWPA